MSHVVTLKTNFKNLEALRKTCELLGLPFLDRQTYKWYGYWVDDSPVPRNLFATQEEYDRVVAMTGSDRKTYMNGILGKCDYCIQIPGATYEVGVKLVGDSYQLIWDWSMDSVLYEFMGDGTADGGKVNPIPQRYALEAAKIEAKKQGHMWKEEQLQDGSIKLHIKAKPQW